MKVKIKTNLPIIIAEYAMCFIAILYSPVIVGMVFTVVCALHVYANSKALQSEKLEVGEIYPLKVIAASLITTAISSAGALMVTSLVAVAYCLILGISIEVPNGVKSLALIIVLALLTGMALMYKCAAKEVDKENKK